MDTTLLKQWLDTDISFKEKVGKTEYGIVQKEGTIVDGAGAHEAGDYSWGVVYLYSLKKLFTTRYQMISAEDLERTILK